MNELSDDAVQQIQSLQVKAITLIDDDTDPSIAALIGHIPALCATVRALCKWNQEGCLRIAEMLSERESLREQLAQLESEHTELTGIVTTHGDTIVKQQARVDELQSQLAQVTQERDGLLKEIQVKNNLTIKLCYENDRGTPQPEYDAQNGQPKLWWLETFGATNNMTVREWLKKYDQKHLMTAQQIEDEVVDLGNQLGIEDTSSDAAWREHGITIKAPKITGFVNWPDPGIA